MKKMEERIAELTAIVERQQHEIKNLEKTKEFWRKESNKWEAKQRAFTTALESLLALSKDE